MHIEKFDSISYGGKAVNEDIATIIEGGAWVLDGATVLNGSKLNIAGGDAKWFVDNWNTYLCKNISDRSRNLKEIVREGILQIREKYINFIDIKDVQPYDLPSCGIVLLRWNFGKFEYLVLGDCTLLLLFTDGKVVNLKDRALEKFDDEAIKFIHDQIVRNGISFAEARAKAKELLTKNRALKNTEEGYWILGFEEEAAEHSICGTFDTGEVAEALLMTDGFAALIDKYGYTNEYEIFAKLEKTNLEELYKILRNIENKDPEGVKYPRLKKCDDASAVYIKFI